ncbi:MAG: secretin and TonB N-terminal domain-containing protein [Candidatus Pacebacteria bacterium]|nr:secretin and TonB N-terminal domain-containing protein [Candidatus Paceibacterota bacterium]
MKVFVMRKCYCFIVPAILFIVSCTHMPSVETNAEPPAPNREALANTRVSGTSIQPQPATDVARRQDEALDRALRETEEALTYPETYGHTVVISADDELYELPRGPMEDLINQPVTMHLTDAGVEELVEVLNQFEGLNFIADEALSGKQKLTINVKDVPLHELLNYIARNMGIAFHIGANTIWITESAKPAGGGPRLITRIYPLRSGTIPVLTGEGFGGGEEDEELLQALQEILAESPENAVLRVFKNRNLLLLRNTRENIRAAEDLLKHFDAPPQQVLIEARFLTISYSDAAELGVDIQRFEMDPRDPAAEQAVMSLLGSSTFPGFAQGASGLNLAVTGILGNHEYEAVLHALEKSGRTRTLSAPRVTVVNNQTAEIRRGDKIFYFGEYDLESTGGDNPATRIVPTGSPTELELGITLSVKVNIGNDRNKIMLALQPEIIEFVEWVEFETGSDEEPNNNKKKNEEDDEFENRGGLVRLPRTNENKLTTSAVVESGETVVLGGMISHNKDQSIWKVPILGDLPLVGQLFRHKTYSDNPQHLIIFVTASLLDSSGRYMQTSE